MIFNSLTYILLLFLVVTLYWSFPYKARLILIFTSSLVFYGFWKISFIDFDCMYKHLPGNVKQYLENCYSVETYVV